MKKLLPLLLCLFIFSCSKNEKEEEIPFVESIENSKWEAVLQDEHITLLYTFTFYDKLVNIEFKKYKEGSFWTQGHVTTDYIYSFPLLEGSELQGKLVSPTALLIYYKGNSFTLYQTQKG